MTIRERIEAFIYPFLEEYTAMVYRDGEDTTFHGIRLLDDDIKFTHGALVNAGATLYAHYIEIGDSRAPEVLKRLHYFIKIAAEKSKIFIRRRCWEWDLSPVFLQFLQPNAPVCRFFCTMEMQKPVKPTGSFPVMPAFLPELFRL